MTQQTALAIHGMHCGGCTRVVQRVLERDPGVVRCTVSLETGRAEVTHDPEALTPDQLAATLTRAG